MEEEEFLQILSKLNITLTTEKDFYKRLASTLDSQQNVVEDLRDTLERLLLVIADEVDVDALSPHAQDVIEEAMGFLQQDDDDE